MTVKELIEDLQKLDPEMPVYVHSEHQSEFMDADEEGYPAHKQTLQKMKATYKLGKRAGKTYTYLMDAEQCEINPETRRDEPVGKPFDALVFLSE